MPTRNRAGREGVDPLLKHDAKFYKKAWEKQRDAERINNERALAHKFLWDKLKKLKPDASCDDLMALAHHLEDQGQLEEAVEAYQKILTGPNFQQQDNRELRAHLGELVARVNRRQAQLQALKRNAEFEEEGRLQPGRPKGLEPQRAAGVPRSDKPVGAPMPMSPEAYRAELAAQAMEVRRRREAEKRRDELLDAKQVAVAAAMEALEKHQRRVVGGNDKVAYGRQLDLAQKDREEERRRQFYLEWDQLKAAKEEGVGGPLGGMDEYARRRAQEQVAAAAAGRNGAHPDPYDYHQPGAAVAAGLRQRPASAGGAAAIARARERTRELDRNNAANFERLYVPGHPYAPVGGPPPPAAAWPAAPAAAPAKPAKSAVKGAGAGKAPFGRPEIDRPKVAIDPKAVRAHQQAFLDKHRKRAPEQKPQVPMRLRKEAERKPSQPAFSPAAW